VKEPTKHPQSAKIYDLGRTSETVDERARRMHREAQLLACAEAKQLRLLLGKVIAKSEKIRDGGELFPVGIREQARQLAAVLPQIMLTLQSLTERHVREVTHEPMPPVWGRDRPEH
jgi:hypothetical protein